MVLKKKVPARKERKVSDALTGVHLRTSTLPDTGVSGIENHRFVNPFIT